MNILGFDTCFDVCSAALGVNLGTPKERMFVRSEGMKTGHAERLIPMIQDLLSEAHISMQDIHKIAVTNGPGSFTGVRISIAAARAFHLAWRIPLVPFTSLETIALNTSINEVCSEKDLVVAVDAHREEAYIQVFDGTTKEPIAPPRLVPEKDYCLLAKDRPLYVVGTAALKVVEAVQKTSIPVRSYEGCLWPSMPDMVLWSLARGPFEKDLEPLYIRAPDAKPQEDKVLMRV